MHMSEMEEAEMEDNEDVNIENEDPLDPNGIHFCLIFQPILRKTQNP